VACSAFFDFLMYVIRMSVEVGVCSPPRSSRAFTIVSLLRAASFFSRRFARAIWASVSFGSFSRSESAASAGPRKTARVSRSRRSRNPAGGVVMVYPLPDVG